MPIARPPPVAWTCGLAVSAARAVIQTGEYDFGWNIQVEDDVLLRLEKGGKGKTVYAVGGDTEFIALNFTDPNTEVDGERSSMKTKHPLFSDPAVRKALSLLVDRDAIKKVIYGRAGRTTGQRRLDRPGRLLQQISARQTLPSLILWGPPGTGKTTLARLIARRTKSVSSPM